MIENKMIPKFIRENEDLQLAYVFANHAHTFRTEDGKPQVRKFTGVPYIIHPLSVTRILVANGVLDRNMLKAALLHDVVEDTLVEIDEIIEMFGEDVGYLVDGMTKESLGSDYSRSVRKDMDREAYSNYCERVQTIKAADCLHNGGDFRLNNEKSGAHCLRWFGEAEELLSALMLADPIIRQRAIKIIQRSIDELTPKFIGAE